MLSRDEILKVYNAGPDAVVDLVQSLLLKIENLTERVNKLENQLNQNSRNSSKPPSSDGFNKPQPKSLREKGNNNSGGQKGHQANWLKMSDNPDRVITHEVRACNKCHRDLSDVPPTSEDARQVFNIIVKMESTEHRVQTKICTDPNCRHRNQSAFPEGVDHKTQYGSSTKGLLSYLNVQQLLPLNRITEMIYALTGHPISEGAIFHANQELYAHLESEEQKIKSHLLQSPVLHSDESGARVNGNLHWFHVACTPTHTFYAVHEKRGKEAMDKIGLLSDYKGTNVRDGLKAYDGFSCKQALCNEHHHRELNAVVENEKQPWAKELIELLYTIKNRKSELIQQGHASMDPLERDAFEEWYQTIVEIGLAENPLSPKAEIKRGRVKQSKTRNLLDRLNTKRDAVLAFMHDFQVPFTNNEAERAIRMLKNQQKISGTFRSKEGAKIFCRIRGFVSTLRKQQLPILPMLRKVLEGEAVIPEPTI